MDITKLIDEFVNRNQRNRNKIYFKICKTVLLGNRPYSLNSQPGFSESEYLPDNIEASVTIYSSNKDTAIAMYKDLVAFLKRNGIDVPDVSFPPIPVSSSHRLPIRSFWQKTLLRYWSCSKGLRRCQQIHCMNPMPCKPAGKSGTSCLHMQKTGLSLS